LDRVWLFYTIQVAASGYALLRGGAPERLTGLALLLAAALTGIVQRDIPVRFVGLEVGVMIVDLILLAVMIVITLHADRFWPAWVTALHALGTGATLPERSAPT
jgi:hypothetical protein